MKSYIGREYLQIYIDFLEECGADVGASQWMARHGHCLEPEHDSVSFAVFHHLRDEFADITGEPMFPFRLGYYLVDNLGTALEYSLKSCHDLREIADLSTRFQNLRSNVVTPRYQLTARHLTFELTHALEDETLWLPLLFAISTITHGFLRRLFGNDCDDYLTLMVAGDAPGYFRQIASQVPFHIRFNCPLDSIAIDANCLKRVNPADDPRLKSLLLQTVEAKCQRMGLTQDFRHKVRTILNQSAPHYPNMDDTASALHLSKRTLARRLHDEHTTYLNILNEVRLEESVRYLEQGLRVSEIANQLGYESTASFINLFKKKTGKTPSEYRKESP